MCLPVSIFCNRITKQSVKLWKHYLLVKKFKLMFLSLSFSRALSDLNKDGKMDQQEFSIAMKLIKLKLQGQHLPMVLPPIMKQPPVVFSPLISARFGTYEYLICLLVLRVICPNWLF